jgi:ABC-2 type transport system permease protein
VRLLKVELTRFATRRFVVVVVLIAAVVTTVLAVSAAYATRPADDTERAAAEQLLTREELLAEEERELCLERQEAADSPGAVACEQTEPQLSWFLPREPLDLAAELEDRGQTLMFTLVGAAVLLGATFTGPDWSSGSMGNQLLQVPRRTTVWLAKALAVVLATTAVAAVLLAAFWGSLAAVAAARGSAPTAAAWDAVLPASGRGLALVAAVALGSHALTMLLRHTVGTLGLLFGYAVIGEGLAASLPFERMSQWSLARNVQAFLRDGVELSDRSICAIGERGCVPRYDLTAGHASTYLGVLLLLAVVGSVVTFARRDVP